jgi:hypothetical protein
MWRTCMSILVSGWILTTPFLWAHRPAQVAVAVLVGFLGFLFSTLAVIRPRFALALFGLGAARALSAFFFPDTFAGDVDALSSGLLLAIAGMYPRLTVIPAATAAAAPAVTTAPWEHEPEHRVAA